MTANIAGLQDAIRRLHGCQSTHIYSIPVKESFRGHTVWDGVVEEFDLTGHPLAKRCYAWSYQGDDGAHQYVAVLALPPIATPLDAVRAAIAAKSKRASD